MAKPWHRQDVIAEVRKRGSSLALLALQHGYDRRTLNGFSYRRYPRAHTIIADFLGRSRHEIWPQWYGPRDELLPLAPVDRRKAA